MWESRALSAGHSDTIVTHKQQELGEEINSAHREQKTLDLPREILTFLKCKPAWHCFNHNNLHTMHTLHKTRPTNDKQDNFTKQITVGQKVSFLSWDFRYLSPPQTANQAELNKLRVFLCSHSTLGRNPHCTCNFVIPSHPTGKQTQKAQGSWKQPGQFGNASSTFHPMRSHPHQQQPQILLCATLIPVQPFSTSANDPNPDPQSGKI